VYNYIHEMGYDPKSTTTVTTPLDPNIIYSQEDCPSEVDVDLRAKVWSAHGKLIHLVWSRPLSKTEITKEEEQVECLLGALREGVVFGLLGAEAHGGAQLDFPTAGGTI
jgi:hypothetical protein